MRADGGRLLIAMTFEWVVVVGGSTSTSAESSEHTRSSSLPEDDLWWRGLLLRENVATPIRHMHVSHDTARTVH